MKKLLSALVCLGIVIGMGAVVGCGDKKPEPPKADPKKTEEPAKK